MRLLALLCVTVCVLSCSCHGADQAPTDPTGNQPGTTTNQPGQISTPPGQPDTQQSHPDDPYYGLVEALYGIAKTPTAAPRLVFPEFAPAPVPRAPGVQAAPAAPPEEPAPSTPPGRGHTPAGSGHLPEGVGAKCPTAGIHGPTFLTRLNAIDTIGQFGSKSGDAAVRLRDLLKLAFTQCVTDDERTLFALHVVQALGRTGYKAQGMVSELAMAVSIDPALIPFVMKAESDILNAKPPATPTQNPQQQHQQQPQPVDPNVQAVQTQFSAVTTALKALSDAITQLQTALGKLPGAKPTPTP